jgi:hypothetical protein
VLIVRILMILRVVRLEYVMKRVASVLLLLLQRVQNVMMGMSVLLEIIVMRKVRVYRANLF